MLISLSCLWALSLSSSSTLSAQGSTPLWERPAWRAALRYQAVRGGWQSEVSDASFFLSAQGHQDPQGEWIKSAALLDKALAHPQEAPRWARLCTYPDRFVVLAELLIPSLDLTERLIERCPGLQEWRDLGARGVAWTIAGPSFAHPASALGHASLWLKSQRGVERALSFGAHISRALDALGALVGWSEGAWTLEPYEGFERRYRVLEQRDMAHLPIALSPKALARLGLHLKSVEGASLPYSFFGDNCATQAIKLVEVARALAGETDTENNTKQARALPLIVRPKALPSLSPLTLWTQATLAPSRPHELSSLSAALSPQERAKVEALFEENLTHLLSRLEAPLSQPKGRLSIGLPKSEAGWRLALMWLELKEPSLNAPPPLQREGELPPLAWRVRQALLTRLSEAEPSPLTLTLTRPQSVPQSVPQLLRDPPMLSPELSFTHLTPLTAETHSMNLTGALTLRLWRDPLTEPLLSAREALIAQGPQLWVSAPLKSPPKLSPQRSLTSQLRGGVLWFNLWSLRALNTPQPHASWRLLAGSWAPSAQTLGARQPFWVEGGVGGAFLLRSLHARVWVHTGARAELSSHPLLIPTLQFGVRGSLKGRLGWQGSLNTQLLDLMSASSLEHHASLQLSISLPARLRLTLGVMTQKHHQEKGAPLSLTLGVLRR